MKTPENTFKSALREGRLQLGLWLALADAYGAEICATCGYDWLLLDGEHAPNDLRGTLAALQAVAPYASHPVVRIPKGDDALIKQVLDLGATTLLVPMVESAAQARQLVRAMRYPPQGIRGVGSAIARSARWTRYPNYLHEANDQVCLLVQVETREALAQAEEIAQVEGVDGVFIGPADLSASMGLLGQAGHPEVKAAITEALGRIARAGKAPGILCADEALARHYIEAGARFIALGVDTTLLVKAASGLVQRFRTDGGAPAVTPGAAVY
ncbi:MAG TPA: 4-hydroxy-2-oxoheptanedioate aldolase [Ramlibacter sp.]|nr:4-hydroxy-2-oxoheptanedioate aldolase [Ramlibacter sp.]